MAKNAQKKGGLTTTHIILIVGFVAVIGVIVGLFLYLNREKSLPEADTGPAVITEANLAEVEDELRDQIEKSQFQTSMNTKWSFPNGSSPSDDAVIGNSSANNYDFYFTLTLADTQEQIYKSGIIPVGKQLKELVLDTPLPAGTYRAICKYQLIDENGEEIESSLGFNVTLYIES